MNRLLIVLIGLPLSVGLTRATPLPEDAKESAVYFPTTPGAAWVYALCYNFAPGQVREQGDQELVVTGVTRVPAGFRVRVRERSDGKLTPFETFEVGPRGLSLVEVEERPLEAPWELLRLPHRVWNRWETTPSGSRLTLRLKQTDAGPEVVRLPCGRFDSVRVESELTEHRMLEKEPRQYRYTHWYAKGVGLIRRVHVNCESGTQSEMVLKSFSPGKDRAP